MLECQALLKLNAAMEYNYISSCGFKVAIARGMCFPRCLLLFPVEYLAWLAGKSLSGFKPRVSLTRCPMPRGTGLSYSEARPGGH